MAKRKEYRHVLIVDEVHTIMVWSESDHQIVYCTDENWQDEHTPAKAYTKAKAKEYINKTIRNRKRWKMEPGVYKTVPFDMPKRRK